MNIYERLRSIGVSIETADILEPVLERMPKRKQEAFVLWAMGYSEREVGKMFSRSKWWVQCIIKKVQTSQKNA